MNNYIYGMFSFFIIVITGFSISYCTTFVSLIVILLMMIATMGLLSMLIKEIAGEKEK